MKKFLLNLILLLPIVLLMTGCRPASTTTSPAALAPGYSSIADQKAGQDLAALNGFVNSEQGNFKCDATAKAADTCLNQSQQDTERPYLNSLIEATNVANALYVAFHQGTETLDQVQSALTKAEQAQSTLVTNKGVK